jgi:predicted DNA-binding transcriptional regulator YafY
LGRAKGTQTAGNYFRILTILRSARPTLLPDGTYCRALTTTEIATELQRQDRPPSRSTVNGYLNDLADMDPPAIACAFSSEGKESYWALDPNSPLSVDSLSVTEAWMVVKVTEVMLPLLPPSIRKYAEYGRLRAEKVLQHARNVGVLPLRNPFDHVGVLDRVWVEKPPRVADNVMEAVFEALQRGERLKIEYLTTQRLGKNQRPLQVIVSPLRMVVHGDARIYLLVTDADSDELLESHDFREAGYRRLAMHRISSAVPAGALTKPRPDVDKFVQEQPGFAWQGRIRLEARVHTGVAIRLHESPLNETQKLVIAEGEDWHKLSVVVDHNWELRWWVLSHGHAFIVDGPEHFREEIAEHFVRGREQYMVRAPSR